MMMNCVYTSDAVRVGDNGVAVILISIIII
jgi:hypothetical protein